MVIVIFRQRRRRSVAALASLVLLPPVAWLAGAAALVAAEPQPRFEIKHIGPGDRVTVESPLDPQPDESSDAPPRAKVTPFAEDDMEAPPKRPAAPTRVEPTRPGPVRLAPPKNSTFKPKFRSPAIRQTQHLEPVDGATGEEAKTAVGSSVTKASATEPAVKTAETASGGESGPALGSAKTEEISGPQLQPIPVPADPLDSPGRGLVDQAFAKSKQASTDAEFSEVIDLCRQGAKAGLKKGYEDYARKLLGWTFNRRGEQRVRAGQPAEALADFEMAVKCSPQQWRALHNRGVSYAAQGKWREALADFNRTIELNKDFGNAWFNRAEIKASQADIPGAIRDYGSALALNPKDATIYSARGYAFYRLRRFGEALRDYSSALEIDPALATALINRGDVYCDLGRYAEAAADYRAAVDANPKLGKAYQSAAWLMATCPDEHYRNEQLAITAAKKAIELSGEPDYRCLETLAAAHANAKQYADAQRAQEQAVALASPVDTPTAQQRLAIYMREQPYREQPRVSFAAEEGDEAVRKASATSNDSKGRRPGRQNLK